MAEFSLAGMLQAKGESDEAIRLLRGNIEKKTSHLQEGADHPDTLDSMMLLATILLAQGVTEEAENLAVRIIEGRGRSLGPDDTGTLEAVKLLLNIYLKAGKNEKVAALQDRITDSSIRTGDSAQLGSVRQVAYQFYISGEYGRAERILRALVEKRFEVASNWCHLARIFIIEDRVSDAEDVVASAWEFRSGTPAYVVPRVLWLRLALLRLTGDGSESWPSWHLLGLIKTVLTASGAFESWTMDPVMEHLKGKLPGHDRELLAALVSAFSNSSSLADLDGFPEWRNQPPVPLDEFHLTTRGAQTLD